jgi:hypothetical protein
MFGIDEFTTIIGNPRCLHLAVGGIEADADCEGQPDCGGQPEGDPEL